MNFLLQGKTVQIQTSAEKLVSTARTVRNKIATRKLQPKKIDFDNEKYLANYRKHANDFSGPIQYEMILSEASRRYTVFPVQNKRVWDNYKTQLALNWVVEEVDLSKDVEDWKNLSDDDRFFLMHILAFFAAADGIVNANIKENLIDLITIKEAECAYGKQFEMENAHGEMYSLMLDTFIQDDELKDALINSVVTMPCIAKKADWCERWINSDKSFSHKLVAFSIVEGVFFSGSFASIFWLKIRRGSVMPGLRKSNKFISRDEAQHVELAIIIYSQLVNKLKQDVIYKIIEEAVEIEDEYINVALPCKLLGMNSEYMSMYIRYCADRILVRLGYEKLYNVENPLTYMDKIDSFCKTNFFENRSDAYSDAKIDNPRIFSLDDFEHEEQLPEEVSSHTSKSDGYCKPSFFESRSDNHADIKIDNPRIFSLNDFEHEEQPSDEVLTIRSKLNQLLDQSSLPNDCNITFNELLTEELGASSESIVIPNKKITMKEQVVDSTNKSTNLLDYH